jgi:ribosome biogenesis GTPase A
MEKKETGKLREWAKRLAKHIRHAGNSDVVLISAATGFGYRELEDTLKKHMTSENPKSLYVVGRANSGKSAFVNRFLKFIGYKNLPSLDLKNGVGGLTQAPIPGTTVDFMRFVLPRNFHVYDTPGLPLSAGSILRALPKPQDFFSLAQKLRPLTLRIREGQSLVIGGLAEMAFTSNCVVVTFFSRGLTLQICASEKSPRVMKHEEYAKPGSRLDITNFQEVEVLGGNSKGFDDISISGLGWLSIVTPGFHRVQLKMPDGVRAFRRPAMLPDWVKTHKKASPSQLALASKPHKK